MGLSGPIILHAVSEGDQGNPNGMVAGNLKIVHFTWVSQPCNAKNTVNTTVFDSMDGGGVEPTTSGLQAARGGG